MPSDLSNMVEPVADPTAKPVKKSKKSDPSPLAELPQTKIEEAPKKVSPRSMWEVSIKVNGVEILTTAVDWTTSHSGTATLLAAQINTTVSSPEYSAAASGPAVVISAAAGSGIGPNGFSVEITTAGNVKVNNLAVGTNVIGTMNGGVAAASGQAQISTITVHLVDPPGEVDEQLLEDAREEVDIS